jgi:excisionase family DNA binding protein
VALASGVSSDKARSAAKIPGPFDNRFFECVCVTAIDNIYYQLVIGKSTGRRYRLRMMISTNEPSNGLLTIEQAAESLGLKVPTIRAWMLRRKIGFVKVGERATRIPLSEIRRIVEKGFVPPAVSR